MKYKVWCDFCGKETYDRLHITADSNGEVIGYFDICKECYENFVKVVKNE